MFKKQNEKRSKTIYKDKVKLYRFGTLVKSLYIFIIILLGDKIVNYVWLIGTLSGVSTATSAFPFNMIESENILPKERGKYLGYASAAMEITSLIVPVLLGAYITARSYTVVAIWILIIALTKLIISFKIQNKNIQTKKVNIKGFCHLIKKDKTLKKVYLIEFFKGINRNGVMSLVVSLLIIYNTANEFELGGWTSFFSLLSIIAMYLFGKLYNQEKKKSY